jgi:hypothetical protein
MPTELYNVRFYGKIAEGRTPEEVKHQLITRFKVPAKQLEEAFAGKPFFIKMKVDRQSALKYKAAFEQSGALCAIEPVSQAPKTRQPASSKTSNISNQSGSTEFSTEFYNVKFYGKIAEGQTVEGVNHQLATRFKIPAKLLEEAFLGKPFFIKDKVDYQTALKYKAAFEQAGALCSIEPVSQTPTRQRPPHVPPVPPLVSGKEVSAPETQPQLVNCPNCGLKQKQALKCTRCEAFLKQPVKNQTDEAKKISTPEPGRISETIETGRSPFIQATCF